MEKRDGASGLLLALIINTCLIVEQLTFTINSSKNGEVGQTSVDK